MRIIYQYDNQKLINDTICFSWNTIIVNMYTSIYHSINTKRFSSGIRAFTGSFEREFFTNFAHSLFLLFRTPRKLTYFNSVKFSEFQFLPEMHDLRSKKKKSQSRSVCVNVMRKRRVTESLMLQKLLFVRSGNFPGDIHQPKILENRRISSFLTNFLKCLRCSCKPCINE